MLELLVTRDADVVAAVACIVVPVGPKLGSVIAGYPGYSRRALSTPGL